MSLLAEITERLDALSPEERKRVVSDAVAATQNVRWVPNPGPQTDAYFCEADELLYGGSAGSGKSDLLVGLSLTAHHRSLILRRTNAEATKLVDRYVEVIGSRNGWNGQDHVWRLDGRIIDIGGCQHEDDKQKRKGIAHDLKCVGEGTLVLMGNREYKPVETVVAGDMVMTLEGPRRVVRAFKTPHKQTVSVQVGGITQVQSANHAVLSRTGWVPLGTSCAFSLVPQAGFAPTEYRYLGKALRAAWRMFVSALQAPRMTCGSARNGATPRATSRDPECSLHQKGLRAGKALPAKGIDCAGFGDEHEALSLPRKCFDALLAHPLRILSSSWLDFVWPSLCREGFGALRMSAPEGSMGGCLSDPRRCDARIPGPSGLRSAQVSARSCSLLLVDAAQQNPKYLPEDAQEQTHRRSHRTTLYAHPYTQEIRQSAFSLRECSCLVSPAGEAELFDLEVEEVNHFITYGGIINKNCFDELVDFTETQYLFITTWNRSTNNEQRCRVVATTNPPTDPDGLWVIRRWAAWLDPDHPNPAKSGELRWYTVRDDGVEIEVDGPGPHYFDGLPYYARSRTFIRGTLADNPDLAATNYGQMLDALPQELREAYRDGKFNTSLQNQPFQCIPAAWVRAAQARWTPDPPSGVPMCTIGVDCTGGGDDAMVMAPRYDGYYAQLREIAGRDMPKESLGSSAAGHVISIRRNEALPVIDMGGGYGGSLFEHLSSNGIEAKAYRGAQASIRRSACGKFRFTNTRSAAYWLFREALDPDQPGGSPIALPPDQELLAELVAPSYKPTPNGIQLEAKEKVVKRLGWSTNKADAVVMAWFYGPKETTHALEWADQRQRSAMRGQRPRVVMGRQHARRR